MNPQLNPNPGMMIQASALPAPLRQVAGASRKKVVRQNQNSVGATKQLSRKVRVTKKQQQAASQLGMGPVAMP